MSEKKTFSYTELKERHRAETAQFPFVFAFTKESLFEGMKEKWGLEPTDLDKIRSVGRGGFIRKSDSEALHELLNRHIRETQEAIDADKTGDGFIFDMFNTELANHEYGYTGDASDTLDALGITSEQLEASEPLRRGLQKAMDYQMGRDTVEAKPLDDVIADCAAAGAQKPLKENAAPEKDSPIL